MTERRSGRRFRLGEFTAHAHKRINRGVASWKPSVGAAGSLAFTFKEMASLVSTNH